MSKCAIVIGAVSLSFLTLLSASPRADATDEEKAPADSTVNLPAPNHGDGGPEPVAREVTCPADNLGLQPLPFKYIGNSFSSKFHRPSCPFARCISSRHLVLFARRKDATDQKFVPCRYCLPPSWTQVHAIILSSTSRYVYSEHLPKPENSDENFQKSIEPAK